MVHLENNHIIMKEVNMAEHDVYGMRVDRFLAEMPKIPKGKKTIWKTEKEKEENQRRVEEAAEKYNSLPN